MKKLTFSLMFIGSSLILLFSSFKINNNLSKIGKRNNLKNTILARHPSLPQSLSIVFPHCINRYYIYTTF